MYTLQFHGKHGAQTNKLEVFDTTKKNSLFVLLRFSHKNQVVLVPPPFKCPTTHSLSFLFQLHPKSIICIPEKH